MWLPRHGERKMLQRLLHRFGATALDGGGISG
jgi:hypothetical protein